MTRRRERVPCSTGAECGALAVYACDLCNEALCRACSRMLGDRIVCEGCADRSDEDSEGDD